MSRIRAEEALKGLDADALLTMAFDSPDWPTVIMVGSFLELLLERAILTRLTPVEALTKRQTESLFGANGTISSFASKISMAYALGLLSKTSNNDLKIIKSIRNDAAHRIDNFSFDNHDTKQKCTSLTQVTLLPESEIPLSHIENAVKVRKKLEILGEKSGRAKFIIAYISISGDIISKMLMELTLRATTLLVVAWMIKKVPYETLRDVAEKIQTERLLERLIEDANLLQELQTKKES